MENPFAKFDQKLLIPTFLMSVNQKIRLSLTLQGKKDQIFHKRTILTTLLQKYIPDNTRIPHMTHAHNPLSLPSPSFRWLNSIDTTQVSSLDAKIILC